MEIEITVVGTLDGEDASKIMLKNDKGTIVSILTSGATLQEFLVPSKEEGTKNLIIGFDNPDDYYQNTLCVGQSIGRVAGRLANGRFKIANQDYQVEKNEKGNYLHGGIWV